MSGLVEAIFGQRVDEGPRPRAFAEWRGRHAGETIIVCGCGRSLHDLPDRERWVTIGVNDVGRLFTPTYLVVLNPPSQFAGDRFRHVQESRARALFTQLDDRQLGARHPHLVQFRLGRRGGTDVSASDSLPHTRNSPYVAACLAAFMGARRIGIVGVDLTDHHFFAPTGRHSLARELAAIDREYGALAAALARRGIELVNLSRESRLSSLRKADPSSWLDAGAPAPPTHAAIAPAEPADDARPAPARVFFVHYQFLSCGDVFRRGLEGAARDLGLAWAGADCADPRLPEAVEGFRPDLLFVVHGRAFRQKWGDRFRRLRKAVWLLDEPYEVDDTVATSRLFDIAFVNDPATLRRHLNAHYLPVAWDPHVHRPSSEEDRQFAVGFIGGGNPTREAMLLKLAREGLLSYVVGGPWRAAALRALSLGNRVPPLRTAELYRQTRIIVNVFRDRHHYNRQRLPATSLNPRVYEALACGALVVSEERPERAAVFPDLPSFRDADGLVEVVRRLLSDDQHRGALLAACRDRLAPHTYAERLRAALAAALPAASCTGRETMQNRPIPKAPSPARVPETSILMAVHGGLELTRLAVLRTLRYSAGADARLVVVDNASTDGTREWLRLMAQRGDLDLLESESNRGHGPALELARQHTRSPYLVTLDSDAFPLCHDWLAQLRARLDAGADAAGILHHRGYVHPSCLMVARRLLDDQGLSFLDEKDRAAGLDVAERISVEITRRGGRLAGLERTGARRRGSRSEPVYLGSVYEGIVYHQWYSTRAATAPGRPVDDVPREAIEESMAEVLDEGRREPREVTVVVGVRATDEERRRNARATLTALNFQQLERYRYRIVVVEQDQQPRLAEELAPLADRVLFAPNSGPYNRGWGFNIGAVGAGPETGALCLMDADLLPPPDFLRRGLEALSAGARSLLPYRAVRYLGAADSERAIAERLSTPAASLDPERFAGRTFGDSQGGALWVDAGLYRSIDGYDERFRGWGFEDREICLRLETAGHAPGRLEGCLLHLDHPRPAENDALAARNQELYQALCRVRPRQAPRPIGDPLRYACERSAGDDAPSRAGWREWEQWHQWEEERIARILEDERKAPPGESSRRALVDLAVRLGSRILDLGCGPGALWPHFARYRSRVTWAGTDVTAAMVAMAHRSSPDVPVVRADGGRLPWRDSAFDVVVLRHVLEHLPPWLLQETLAEAFRVARRAVLIAFYVAPVAKGPRHTRRVGEGFLETCWARGDIEGPAASASWSVRELRPLGNADEEVWILAPNLVDLELLPAPEPTAEADEPLKFSIIMPTFRRRTRLTATVATVLGQTYRNWELIVVDNAGDCDVRFADPRIGVFVHAERASAAYARNKGLRYVTGDLVCFFDDDDDMFPDYLARLADAFRAHPQAKMVRCGMVVGRGSVNYSYATPEVCLRREYATPTWAAEGMLQDQHYYRRIVERQGWREPRDIVFLRVPLCRANSNPGGGLRAGRY